MYHTGNGQVTDAQAAKIETRNKKIWENFWKIPKEKRTAADFERLLDIQILAK